MQHDHNDKHELEESAEEFTADERKRLRNLMILQERKAWLYASIGAFAKWIGYVGAAAAIGQTIWQWVRDLLK